MLRIKLTQKETNHSRLRTKEIEGMSPMIPEVGHFFLMFSESLTPGKDLRQINTSEIESCAYFSENRKFVFKTKNSTYEVEILDTVSDEEIMSHKRHVSVH